jgi:phage terminase large subunit-like protein
MSKDRAERVIQFIECLTVPSGVGAGEPFKMRGWQKQFIYDVYGPDKENGMRQVRRAVLSLGRKNGKTSLTACLALAHLVVRGIATENGEIYSAATERDQAGIIYRYAAQIVRADPELNSILKCIDSTKRIVNHNNGSFYHALSSESKSKYGFNPTFVIYDELAQAPNRELYDALDTSMGAREEPLFITISTQSNDPQHILSQLIDDGLSGEDPTTVTHLYEVPMDVEDVYNEECWKLANPALDDFRSLEDLRVMAQRAKRMPSFDASFRNLYLNQRVDAKSPMIPRAEWEACHTEDCKLLDGEEIFLGLDLSGTTDLTAMVAVSANDGDRVKPWFWKPEDLLRDHEHLDRVPYPLWAKQGVIEAVPGRVINYRYIAKKLGEIDSKYRIIGLAFDRWGIAGFVNALDVEGVQAWIDRTAIDGTDQEVDHRDGIRMVPWGQGFRDMGPSLTALEVSILERRLQHDGHPCLTWNISNAITQTDPAGFRKFDKSKARFRIDGAVALAMAIGLKSRGHIEERVPTYMERGIRSLI